MCFQMFPETFCKKEIHHGIFKRISGFRSSSQHVVAIEKEGPAEGECLLEEDEEATGLWELGDMKLVLEAEKGDR